MNTILLTQTEIKINAFIKDVYSWMAIGLTLTGSVAWIVGNSVLLFALVSKFNLLLFISEIVLVLLLAKKISKIKASTAIYMFILYSILNGLTMSYLFFYFTSTSITSSFLICAITFGACSIFGWLTKRDLTGIGNFLFMGLIGICISTVVNIFFKNNIVTAIISYLGVFIFTGLTAYDTQKLKQIASSQPDNLSGDTLKKGSIIGALTLYLDFILMFQYLMYILGGHKE